MTRIQPAEITGPVGAMAKRFSKKKLGEVPESLGVMWHNQRVLRTLMGFSRKAEKWDACDRQLKGFAHMATVSYVGCSFCLDFGYLEAHHKGLDMDKAREVPAGASPRCSRRSSATCWSTPRPCPRCRPP